MESTENPEFCELYLIVRPEEKRAVTTCLDSFVGPVYTTIPGLGRGYNGLTYQAKRRSLIQRLWRNTEPLTVFLPKVVLYLVLPCDAVDELMSAIQQTLRTAGGPANCARGFGFIVPVGDQVVIDGSFATQTRATRPDVGAARNGNAASDPLLNLYHELEHV